MSLLHRMFQEMSVYIWTVHATLRIKFQVITGCTFDINKYTC